MSSETNSSADPQATLQTLLGHLGFEVTVSEQTVDDQLLLDIKSDDPGRLIGRNGQTLGDLQYILNRILFRGDERTPKVMLDVGGYRTQAREQLIKRAKGMGMDTMVGAVDSANVGSIALHTKAGFEHQGTLKGVGRKFGKRLDLAFLVKAL